MSQTATSKRPPKAPFEEPILVKYSPHHEFPLSTVSSIGLHALIIGLLIIAGIIIAKLNWNSQDNPLPSDAVAMEEPQGGGGGNPDGMGNAPGDLALPPPDAADAPLPDPSQPIVVNREQLNAAKKEILTLPQFNDEEGKRLIEEGGKAVNSWLSLKKDVRAKLQEGLAAGKGKGGSGSGGGEGTGQGTGTGSGVGSGTGHGDRSKRVLRWTLIFNTRDGRDYLGQLRAFGAILAIPDDKSPDGYLVIRDLSKPTPAAEDISKIQRIYWIDDKAASVQSLASALSLPAPSHFIVFFPQAFEQELLNMELSYRGKKEDQIVETRFEVRRGRGDRAYDPFVVSQR
jgi:hypothetical protein